MAKDITELLEKQVFEDEQKARKARANKEHFLKLASEAAVVGDSAKQALSMRQAYQYNYDYHYWWGHHDALKGVLAQIELAEVVETELDATPQCP